MIVVVLSLLSTWALPVYSWESGIVVPDASPQDIHTEGIEPLDRGRTSLNLSECQEF